MNQLSLTLEPPKARRSDARTSHAAAKAAERFQASHAGRVLAALRIRPMTAKEISAHAGLSVEQVCRRLPEIPGVSVMTVGGQPVERDGFRVWMAC
jgi:DNA-binding transcriptional regulator GbsR (MarR family)